MKVVISSQQALMREGLEELLRRWRGIDVVGLAPDPVDAVRSAARSQADVLLLVRSTDPVAEVKAISTLRITCPGCRAVLVESVAGRVSRDGLGADRCVGAGIGARALVRALWETCGRTGVGSGEAGASESPAAASPQPLFTRRECDVVRLVCAGLANKLIARRLRISEKTVKNHLSDIYHRAGLSGRTHLAIWAMTQGFGPTPEEAAAEADESV